MFYVIEAGRTPEGRKLQDKRHFFKSLEEAREYFEQIKRLKRVYWSGLYEQESASHHMRKLDSYCN